MPTYVQLPLPTIFEQADAEQKRLNRKMYCDICGKEAEWWSIKRPSAVFYVTMDYRCTDHATPTFRPISEYWDMIDKFTSSASSALSDINSVQRIPVPYVT